MAKKKVYTLNTRKFLTFTICVVSIIAILIVIISYNKKVEINEATDISKLNASKYSSQIANEYNKENMKEKFLFDFNNIQNQISIYLISNSTIDDFSFEKLVDQVNEILKTNDWQKIQIDKPIIWNGNWSVSSEGKLNFKFQNNKIEPNWINDSEIGNLVIKN